MVVDAAFGHFALLFVRIMVTTTLRPFFQVLMPVALTFGVPLVRRHFLLWTGGLLALAAISVLILLRCLRTLLDGVQERPTLVARRFQMLSDQRLVNWALSKDFNLHLFLLHFTDQIKFAQHCLNLLIR